MPRSAVGFDLEIPDFTDCVFATPEPDADWLAVIQHGGPARAFDRRMPAFLDALSEDQINQILGYIRGMCADRNWSRGELNLPRPLRTEKAIPENETRTAERRLDAARPPPQWRPDGAAPPSARRGRSRRLRHRRRHDRARIEVAAERAAPGLRAALRAGGARPRLTAGARTGRGPLVYGRDISMALSTRSVLRVTCVPSSSSPQPRIV